METKSIRIAWCDIYKAIVIILVVIGHTRGGILSNIIYQFHMAAFFWISGYTARNKGTIADEFVRKFCKLILPFYFIVFSGDLIYYIANKFGVLNYFSSMEIPDSFSVLLSGLISGTAIYCDVLGAMWFIPVLFVSGIIFKILMYLFDDKPWRMLIASVCIFVFGEYLALNQIPIHDFDLAGIAQYYMVVGYLFKRTKLNEFVDKRYKIILPIMVIIWGVIFGVLNIRISMDWPSRQLNGWLDLIIPLIGIVVVMCLSKLLELNKKICGGLSYIGKRTYGIMGFHFIGFKVSYLIFIWQGYMSWHEFSYLTPGTLAIWKYWPIIDIIAITFSICLWNLLTKFKGISIFLGKSDELQSAILNSSLHTQITEFLDYIFEIFDKFLEFIYRWKKVVVAVVAISFVGVCIHSYKNNQMDVRITFPDGTDRIEYVDGWLPQSSDENYRWVMQNSEIKVRLSDQKNIKIHGYIPTCVTDMSLVILYVNGAEVYKEKIINGQEMDIQIDVETQLKNNNINIIKLVFDGLYIPNDADADQRSFSALIDSITID